MNVPKRFVPIHEFSQRKVAETDVTFSMAESNESTSIAVVPLRQKCLSNSPVNYPLYE